jgi:hypothetical protein
LPNDTYKYIIMQTLTVYREWGSSYNQRTILKDCNNKVKAIFSSSINQPKLNQKTIVVNRCTFALNWDNVPRRKDYIKIKDRNNV